MEKMIRNIGTTKYLLRRGDRVPNVDQFITGNNSIFILGSPHSPEITLQWVVYNMRWPGETVHDDGVLLRYPHTKELNPVNPTLEHSSKYLFSNFLTRPKGKINLTGVVNCRCIMHGGIDHTIITYMVVDIQTDPNQAKTKANSQNNSTDTLHEGLSPSCKQSDIHDTALASSICLFPSQMGGPSCD
jgi:hypothetical protein